MQLAIGALQNVLSEDFKATDIEVPCMAFVFVCSRSSVCRCGMFFAGRQAFSVVLHHLHVLDVRRQSDQPNAHAVPFVQVGVVQAGVQGGAFRVLPTSEVDEHLTALSERD